MGGSVNVDIGTKEYTMSQSYFCTVENGGIEVAIKVAIKFDIGPVITIRSPVSVFCGIKNKFNQRIPSTHHQKGGSIKTLLITSVGA